MANKLLLCIKCSTLIVLEMGLIVGCKCEFDERPRLTPVEHVQPAEYEEILMRGSLARSKTAAS